MWSGFSSDAKGASADIRGLDTSEFEGDEAETYRGKVNEDLPPHLDTTAEAWSIVATALTTFAAKLEDLQTRMTKLKSQADSQSQAVSSAKSSLSSAKSADQAHATAQEAAKDKLKPGETLPPDSYHGQTSGASSSLSNAQQALQDTIDAAATVRSEHAEAVDACCRDIDRAKEMRFQKPPGFWGKLAESVGDWIKDHADILKSISSVLKTISGIAGMLALIPCLTPIMGPIALATGGAALVIDVGLKLATGEGSWLQIGVDALSMVPGMRAAKVAFAANVGLTGYNISQGQASWSDMAMVVGMGALGNRNAIRNRMSFEAGAFKAGMNRGFSFEPSMATAGGPNIGGGRMHFSGSEFAAGRGEYVHPVTIDSARYPQTAEHVTDAQNGKIWSGDAATPNGAPKPDVLTIDRPGAKANREAWQKAQDVPTRSGYDRDEYPPAMFSEGGADASIKYISPSDNRGAGSTMGWDIRSEGLPNGAKVRIVVS